MYPNLNAELARRGWNKKVLSEKLDARYATIIDKLNGKYPLTLNECKEIKDKLDMKLSMNRPLNVRPKILTLRRSVFLWQNIALYLN